MTKKETLEVLAGEIAWCMSNPHPSDKSVEFRKGFVEGLRQAKHLIREAAKR